MSRHVERARLLFRQNRLELAEGELRQALAENPDEPEAHALLALCLLAKKQWNDATQEAQQAIHLAPDMSYAFYVLAVVMAGRQRIEEAEQAIREAIRLDPFDPDYFATLSELLLTRARWAEALAAAEQGLEAESDHVACTNCRAIALTKMGRREEAGLTIGSALARAPESATTHANMGWTLLEQRDPNKAMEHFREALRLNPELSWARNGIVEAMKARHVLYRWMLSFFLWMARFDTRTQWMLMIGFIVGRSVLLSVVDSVPVLKPLYWPIVIAYLTFAILTWIASPLFNLILRLDRFGRLALSDEQRTASNLLGLCLLTALLVATVVPGFQLATGRPVDTDWLIGGLMCFALALPVTNIHRCEPGWPRVAQAFIAVGLALMIVATMAASLLEREETGSLFNTTTMLLALSTWMGAYLAQARVRH